MDATGNISTDLFYKIRSRFTGLKLGEAAGAITINPEDARFFDFDYVENDKRLGHVSISLAEPNSMKVYFSSGITEGMDDKQKTGWYKFLRELRQFAKLRLLAFDTRDITKDNLDKRDYSFLSQYATPKADNDTITKPVGENVMNESSLYGTKKQSFQKLEDTRLIIKHSKTLADDHEQRPGDRSRNIAALFVENSSGERFKYPFIHLAGARAMQRHVANGGLPYDEIGESIIKMSEEIAQLKSFTNYVVRNDLMNSDTNSIVERSKMQLDNLRETVAKLAKQAHYESYRESFAAQQGYEVPDDVMEQFKEKFTVKNFKEDIAEVFPVLYRLMKEEETVGYDDIVEMTKDVEAPQTEEQLKSDIFDKFENWATALGEESPLVMADDEEKADMIKKLNELVGQEFQAGVDGTNAIQSLEGIIEDPKLEQDIKKKASEDANADIRSLVKAWIDENAPEVAEELDFGDMTDEPAVGADEVEPQQEASGYEGQSEPYAHAIYVDGDYDEDRGIDEKACASMEKELQSKGIKAACEPDEAKQGGVIIHTMTPREKILDALEQAGYQAESYAEEGVTKEGGMSDIMIGVDELISDYTNDDDKESGLKMSKQEVINAIKGEKADPMEIKFAIDTIENDFDDKGNYKYVGQDDMPEGNEFSKKVQDLKSQGAKKGTKFKTSDGEEHTLEDVAKFVHSFYDTNSGTFPKGPEGVAVMVDKKFGEQAGTIARKMVERMAPHQEQGAEELEELERIKSLIQF